MSNKVFHCLLVCLPVSYKYYNRIRGFLLQIRVQNRVENRDTHLGSCLQGDVAS